MLRVVLTGGASIRRQFIRLVFWLKVSREPRGDRPHRRAGSKWVARYIYITVGPEVFDPPFRAKTLGNRSGRCAIDPSCLHEHSALARASRRRRARRTGSDESPGSPAASQGVSALADDPLHAEHGPPTAAV
jgi:hypothetical protein